MRAVLDPEAARIRKEKKQKFEDDVTNRAIRDGVVGRVEAFLNQEDFDLFVKNKTLSMASAMCKESMYLKSWKIRELNVVMTFTSIGACRFWRKRLKPTRSAVDASSEYWDQLKITVEKLSDYLSLEGVTEDIALRIIRTRISTSKTLMRGLPKRLRVWEK